MPTGLFELDHENRVLYARVEQGSHGSGPAPYLVGINLFGDGAPFANANELQRRIDHFRAGVAKADVFDITYDCEYGPLPARVLVTRVGEPEDTVSLLVHVTRKYSSET
jgi:hypothetical protein